MIQSAQDISLRMHVENVGAASCVEAFWYA